MGADVAEMQRQPQQQGASAGAGEATPHHQAARPCQVVVDSRDYEWEQQGEPARIAERARLEGCDGGVTTPAPLPGGGGATVAIATAAAAAGGAPSGQHEERLERYAEAWLQLLRKALPTALEEAAVARAEVATMAARAAGAADHVVALDGGTPGGSSSSAAGGVLLPDSPAAQQLSQQHSPSAPVISKFRVTVPQGYPGVQYRRTKNLADRYKNFAKDGAVVKGNVEDSGLWLRLNDTVFLPMQVGGTQILQAVNVNRGESKKKAGSFWFACGHGSQEEEEEVLANLE